MIAEVPTTIEIDMICRKILKETVLDIFYLIMEHKDISKSEIESKFIEYTSSDEKSSKFRYPVMEGIAKLEGAMFVDKFRDGNSDRYYLTQFGDAAREIFAEIVKEDPLILRGTKILAKVML